MASNFHAGAEREYARTDGTPTWGAFEDAVGQLEGGDAIAFSTGMAAVAAVLETLPVGARVVYPAVSYLGVRRLLDNHADSGRLAIAGVGITDLERLAGEASDRGITSVVDNTFATPLLQRPLELGCDVVVHSATKLIGGHSDLLLGVAVARDEEWAQKLRGVRHDTGATPGGLEAWLALRG